MLLLTVVLVGVGLTACTASNDDLATGHVEDNGFSLKLSDVSATAGAGVSTPGKAVTLTHEKKALKPASTFVKSLGSTIRLKLDKNAQPKTPITLRFKIDKSLLPKGKTSFGVISRSEGSKAITVLPATYNAKSGTLTAKTTHLSFFDPVAMALTDLFGGMANVMLTGLKVQYPEPKDCDGSVTVDSTKFEALASTGAYPCFSSTKDGKVTMVLNSTTSLPLRLTSTPTMSGAESTGTGLDTAAALAVLHVVKQNKSVSELMPGSMTTYTFSPDAPLQSLKIDNDLSTLLLLYTANVFKSLLDSIPGVTKGVETAVKVTDAMDCMSDIQSSKDLSQSADHLVGIWLRTFLNCGGQIPGVGAVWSLVALLPTVVASFALGALNELAGTAHGSMTVTRTQLGPKSVNSADYLTYQGDEGTPYKTYEFMSPSGNLRCSISQYEDSSPWGCSADDFDWSQPDLPVVYGNDCEAYGYKVLEGAMQTFSRRGKFVELCTTGAYSRTTPKVLPINSQIKALGVTCVSQMLKREETMSCSYPGGSSFKMSKSTMTFVQAQRLY